jgi:polar amino acid transport system substrate-binding protein
MRWLRLAAGHPRRSAGRRRKCSAPVVALVLAFLAAALGAACGSDDSRTEPTTTTDPNPGDTVTFRPVTPGVLTVATSLPGPGFFEGSDSDPTKLHGGYEWALADLIRQKLGLDRMVIRNEGFDTIISGELTGYDLALSQISITPARARVVDFTKPYFESQQSALVKSGSPPIETVDTARATVWGVRADTTALTLLADNIRPTKAPLVFPELSDAYSALEGGQVDAVLVDLAINLGEAARSGGRFAVVAQFRQAQGPDQYGGVVPKGSPNLPIFDAIITDLGKTGELKRLAADNLTKDPGDVHQIQL